jgi:hypothetical protein
MSFCAYGSRGVGARRPEIAEIFPASGIGAPTSLKTLPAKAECVGSGDACTSLSETTVSGVTSSFLLYLELLPSCHTPFFFPTAIYLSIPS